jgi:hypothetical protein
MTEQPTTDTITMQLRDLVGPGGNEEVVADLLEEDVATVAEAALRLLLLPRHCRSCQRCRPRCVVGGREQATPWDRSTRRAAAQAGELRDPRSAIVTAVSYVDNSPPISVASVPRFPVPPGVLPAALQRAVDDYQTVRAEHAELLRHLSGSYRRVQDGRQHDVALLRQARQDGKAVTPKDEQAAQRDQDRTLLELESLRQQAAECEARVRAVAAEVALDYRASLDRQADAARGAVLDSIEEIRGKRTELRTVAVCQGWLDSVITPHARVAALGVDTSGIDAALQPVEALLAGPSGEGDLKHYLNNLRQGDRASVFTGRPKERPQPTGRQQPRMSEVSPARCRASTGRTARPEPPRPEAIAHSTRPASRGRCAARRS